MKHIPHVVNVSAVLDWLCFIRVVFVNVICHIPNVTPRYVIWSSTRSNGMVSKTTTIFYTSFVLLDSR